MTAAPARATAEHPHAVEGSRFPFPSYPSGWFQVAFSHEILPGTVRSLHYFGEQLIAYRGEDGGDVRMLDAYCPHQGADLGVGGEVVGDCVKCPFHGWLFDAHGANVEIPYADNVNRGARLRAWTVQEKAGIVFVWYDPDGGAPQWHLPDVPEFTDERFIWHVPEDARWTIRTHVQEVYENTVDVAHFATVHKVANFGTLDVSQDGPMFKAVAQVSFVTPRGPVAGAVDSELWGLGLDVVRHRGLGESCTLLTATPIDEHTVEARYTFLVLRDEETGEMSRIGVGMMRDFIKQIQQDIPIWENKVYRAKPQLARGEQAIITFRKWATTCY
jgi:phenylpropionate dioxygenase-like ring-hydroxylating dioxygenase large terminal subunit